MFKTAAAAHKFQKDLTQGSIVGQLVRFSMPFLLSMLIQQSYSMADMLMISYFADVASVAAVHNGGQITFFVIAIAIGLSIGGTVLIGQYYGAKKTEEVNETAATTMTMMVIGAVTLGVLLFILSNPILHLIRIPPESHAPALMYLRISTIGLPFIFVYNAVGGILRGLGDTKRPLIIVAISCGVNILLNLLFIGYFRWGAAGAALGTVISQIGTVFAASRYLVRKGFFFDFKPKSFVIHKDKLRMILKLGIPSGASQIAVNLSFLLLTMLVNTYGDEAITAATGLAGRLNGFVIMPLIAMQNSVAMICAQNLGAKKLDRAFHTMAAGIAISFALGIPCFFIVRAFTEQIMGLLSREPAVIEAGVEYMRAYAWDYLVVPLVFGFYGLATGAGHTHITMINTLLTSVVLRIPVAYILSQTFNMGLTGIGLAVPVATGGGLLILSYYVISGRWKNVTIHKDSIESEAEISVN